MTSTPAWALPAGLTVTGSDGIDYQLARLIASGGQGSVFEEAGAGLAVKVRDHAGEVDARRIRQSLELLELLPLSDLNVARPLSLLRKPMNGYVMELMSDLEPWRVLIDPDAQDPLRFWEATGGLGRRFALAKSLTSTMASLAQLGLVYADMSPGNVLVTPANHESGAEAWLIDLDNLTYGQGPGLVTRYYGAPELVRGRSPFTSLTTDVWSLAVLLFQTLTLGIHPMIGDDVEAGTVDDENRALQGLLPWVDDQSDRSNAAASGLPRDRVLTRSLRSLFDRCFTSGRLDPYARPSASQFERAFGEAAVQLVRCRSCSVENLGRPGSECMVCHAPLDRFAVFRVWSHPLTKAERELHGLALESDALGVATVGEELRLEPLPGAAIVVPANGSVTVPGWMVEYGSGEASEVELRWTRGGVIVTPRTTNPVFRRTADGDFVEVGAQGWQERPDTLLLRFGTDDQPHRYLGLQVRQGRQP